MTHTLPVETAKEIVRSDWWQGDIRMNFTKAIQAGRVLADRLDELERSVSWYSADKVTHTEEENHG